MTHFLQSHPWKEFQNALGRATIEHHGDDWSYLAIVERGAGNTRLYTPYGPSFDSPAALALALEDLKKEAVRHEASFIRIEPIKAIPKEITKSFNLQPVNYLQLQPTHSQVIELGQSNDELLANMSQNSRNITRNYRKKGVMIRTSTSPNDIKILTSLLASVAHRNHIAVHSSDYFTKQAKTLMPLGAATLYIAELNNSPIAAALVYDSDTTRYYAHAAADDSHRKLQAGTALVGQLILDANDKNLNFVDLYGTTESTDPKHPWFGFTKFKKSFGGTPVTYGGAWDIPVRPLRYKLYRAYQSIRSRIKSYLR